jgi:hypothetical protein
MVRFLFCPVYGGRSLGCDVLLNRDLYFEFNIDPGCVCEYVIAKVKI